MRNLKRALSLTLASVMLLGMMVVGSSAAAGYSDVDENDNVEAIEVLQAVEVMVGDDRGFGPDRPVTRNEMAVVMGKLLDLDYNYYASTCPFNDVADWAKGWVGACAANGIVSGRGNGIYDGESTVTAIEAASMMMRALGYFKNIEDYADGFQVVTVRQGSQIGIFEGVGTDATTAMTRNQVATMALNALRSEMVDFTGTPGIDVNGVKVGYRAEYTPRTSTEAKYNAIEGRTSDVAPDANHKGQYYIQLGEQLYDGDLRLRDGTDDFERPSRVWEYDGKEIGTYMKKELIRGEYSTAVTGKTLYELLGRAVIDDNNVDYFWNGRADETIAPNNMIRTNTKDYDTTGKGVLTQVFFDPDDDEITIVSINTFLADVDDDYDEKKGELPIVNIYTDRTDAASVQFGADTKVGVDEVKGIEGYKDGDKIMVQVAWTGSRYEIVNVQDPEVLTEVSLNKYSEENYVARSGEQWDYALDGKNSRGALDEVTAYDTKSLTDYTYTLYIDKYGYLIGNERSGGNDEYVFIAGYDFRGSNLATATATASAIFLDGTMANIQVDVNETQKNINEYNDAVGGAYYGDGTSPSGRHDGYLPFDMDTADTNNKYLSEYNSWFTYTTETKNGVTVYTLDPVDNWMDMNSTKGEINSASVRLDVTVGSRTYSRAYGNDDSVFLTVDTDAVSEGTIKGISKVNGRYTGVQDVDLKLLTGTDLAAELNGTSKNLGWDATAGHWTTSASDAKYHANVFAVYDDDLYIIGAVIIGDNGGANTDYIYVLDDIKNERVEDGDHYWEVDVAKGGEVQTLTIKTSSSKFRAIRSTIQGALNLDTPEAVNGMLKLTYDADGYVTEAESVVETNNAAKKTTDVVYGNADVEANEDIDPDDEKVYLVQFDDTAYPGDGTVPAGGGTQALDPVTFTAKGRTLWNSYAGDRGLTVVTDAPVVVLQPTKDSKGNIDYDYEVFTGSKAVENAIKSLANKGVNFEGWVAAVLNAKGTAEYLVLSSEICKTIDTVDPDAGNKKNEIKTLNLFDTDQSSSAANDTLIKGALSTAAEQDGYKAAYRIGHVKPQGAPNSNIADILYIPFKTNTAADNVTLTITKAGSVAPVYVESSAIATTGFHYFYVNTKGSYNGGGAGSMTSTQLASGTYTWTIVTADGNFTGEFKIG